MLEIWLEISIIQCNYNNLCQFVKILNISWDSQYFLLHISLPLIF